MTLEEKLAEFVAYRKAIKKPIRPESMDAFKRKLTKLSGGNEEDMIEILDNSIANGWQGIFELVKKINKPTFVEKVISKSISQEELFKQLDQQYGNSNK